MATTPYSISLIWRTARAGTRIPVARVPFLIGRHPQFHLRPTSAAVSERHCLIINVAEHVSVTDLGSENGTFVNGNRVQGTAGIGDGDELRFGPLQFTVRVKEGMDDDWSLEVDPSPSESASASGGAAETVA